MVTCSWGKHRLQEDEGLFGACFESQILETSSPRPPSGVIGAPAGRHRWGEARASRSREENPGRVTRRLYT